MSGPFTGGYSRVVGLLCEEDYIDQDVENLGMWDIAMG